MLTIDPRMGSGELAKFMAILKLPVEVEPLGFGDFAFLGNGEEGVPVPVGVERKALKDWIDSFYNGRFAGHQLPGMLACYQVVYVVIEGIWRANIQNGIVEVPKKEKGKTVWAPLEAGGNKCVMYRDLEEVWVTFEMKGGVMFRRTSNKPETCRFIQALYTWWTEKEWDQHKSHLRFRTVQADAAILTPLDPSNPQHLVRLMAKELKLVGWEKAREISNRFGSMAALLEAGPKELMEVPGIGSLLAHRIWRVLHGLK